MIFGFLLLVLTYRNRQFHTENKQSENLRPTLGVDCPCLSGGGLLGGTWYVDKL